MAGISKISNSHQGSAPILRTIQMPNERTIHAEPEQGGIPGVDCGPAKLVYRFLTRCPTIIPPHPSLSGLPEEIIEHIADCLRYPLYSADQAAEVYLFEGRTRFSSTRFPLSSFSQVSSSIRPAVERILYRDIQLDNIGWIPPEWRTWNTRKHSAWPAASLPLLLQTLEQRPELGHFIRSVQLLWCENLPAGPRMHVGFTRFLEHCPRLHRLVISNISTRLLESVFGSLRPQITSLAAATNAKNFERIIGVFPYLRDLYLQLYGEPLLLSAPSHNLYRLRLECPASEAFLRHVLAICGDTVEDLDISIPSRDDFGTRFPAPINPDCKRVKYLCLRNMDALYTPLQGPHPLQAMPALRHLHLIRPRYFPPPCFTNLPLHLRSITFSDYALDSSRPSLETKSQFISSLADCLDGVAPRIARATTYGAFPDDPWELGDLGPIRSFCKREGIPFSQTEAHGGIIEPEIMIFFK